MKLQCVSRIMMFCFLTCLFCSHAFAQESVNETHAVENDIDENDIDENYIEDTELVEENVQEIPISGFDIRAALAAPYTMSFGASLGLTDMDPILVAGPGFGIEIQAVYRYKKVGFGIEQKLNGIFSMTSPSDENVDETQEVQNTTQYTSLFMGATFLILKEYVNAGRNGLFTFSEGLGLAYGSNTPGKKVFGGKSDYAFAFKFDLGYTYFIQAKYGIGFNLEYMLAINFSKTTYIIGSSAAFMQSFIPKLTYQMIF